MYNKKKPTLIWSAQLGIMNLTQRKFIKIKEIIHISIVNIYVKNFFPEKSCNTCRLNLVKDAGKYFLWNFKVSHFIFPKSVRFVKEWPICKHLRHLISVTNVQKHNTCSPTSPLIWAPCALILPQVYRSLINCFSRRMFIFSYKYSILIGGLNIKDYKIVCINLIHLKFLLFNYLTQCLQS